ncbi:MAG TPA: prolyl oligopeptidase family serine peptidase [Stellaceae bacterium]|jgi:prolyl oligopeptidase|nr:prolyl oligopeptidase family serine peptidase [Stellaceae bacterium]
MSDDDPFLWLEEVEGAAALEWVRGENKRSLAVLEGDPRYAPMYQEALAVVTAPDRIPYPRFLGSRLANFWQDERHVRGLWRATSLASFAAAEPHWQTLIDVDALAAAEGRNWVFQGATCLPPNYRRCLISLSDGGKDAAELREFDIAEAQFVDGGFFLLEGKQSATWLDDDTLIVARDWGPGTMTASGYPFVLKRLARGVPLDEAEEMFRGTPEDVSVGARVLRDPDGTARGVLVNRQVNFFESERWLLTAAARVRVPVPARSSFRGFVAGQLVFSLEEEWRGRDLPTGALVSLDLAECLTEPDTAAPLLIHAPGPREAVEEVAATRTRLLATLYRIVRGSAVAYRFEGGAWTPKPLPLPDNASVHIAAASDRDDRAFVDVAGFLSPNALWLVEPQDGTATPVKSLPARFDAAGSTVEQFEAISADGTPVPYFVVRPAEMPFDGTASTLLYGYGGFQVSMTPSYAGVLGKLWLERGGAYVIANIRGGGEFGPEWHKAALKGERQRAFDDFIAVAEDLIRRGITSPRRLGIMGGSNGGLLMGAMLTQRPELFRAIVIQVPLLDMLRYHKLLAGASWMAEYGDPDRPDEAEFLRRISPYHNLRPGVAYPEPFFVTSTKDDRVHPGHARKMAAKMAAMGLPFFYYENVDGGHSAAANLEERARRNALEFTYLTRKLMD